MHIEFYIFFPFYLCILSWDTYFRWFNPCCFVKWNSFT